MRRAALVIATCVLAACAPRDDAGAASEPARVVERGPVRVEVHVAPDAPQVGDAIEVRLVATAAEGVEVRLPGLADVEMPEGVDADPGPPRPDVPVTGGRRWERSFTMSTFTAGPLELPAMTVSFVDARDAAAPIESEVALEPIVLDVASYAGEQTTPNDIDDRRADWDRGLPGGWPAWLAAALGAVVASIVVAWLLRRRRAAEAVVPVVPPHVLARAALDRLAGEGLLAQGRFEVFYVRLSDIVRGYIEGRFGLMAPERTTDEFLREARDDERLTSAQQMQLGAFLRSADLVKFARMQPAPGDGDQALADARAFVDQTAPDAVEHEVAA